MKRNENGEIMLEGTIVMVLTMIIIIWILGVGFIYYQRFLVTAITNDAAAKVAATYNNPSSDLVMGYIKAENLSQRDLYRGIHGDSLQAANETKASNYVNYMLQRTNFVGTVESVNVKLKLVNDSALRKHVEVNTEVSFNTPFGFALDWFGMNGVARYSNAARADCTDIIDYITTVDFAAYQLSGKAISGEFTKLINSFTKVYNHIYAEN